jgi:hypothetical protein
MSDPPEEDLLAVARRHVAEGKENVGRQEAIVARLAKSKHPALLANAQEILVTLRTSLALFQRDLERLENKAGRDGSR